MTAGQRNCCLAVEDCIQRYSLDDVLFAVREHVLLQGIQPIDVAEADQIVAEIRELFRDHGGKGGAVELAADRLCGKSPLDPERRLLWLYGRLGRLVFLGESQ